MIKIIDLGYYFFKRVRRKFDEGGRKSSMKNMNRIFIIFVIVSQSLFCHAQKRSSNKPGTIILLNGTSSAGKTTLVKELHKIYDTFEVAHIDEYTRTHQCCIFGQNYDGFYKEIHETALAGQNILVDTIFYHKKYAAYDALLKKERKLIKILVYCPLDCLLAHVQKRNRSGDSLEYRNVNKAFYAYCCLYKIANSKKDIVIDTMHSAQVKAVLEQALDLISHWSANRIKLQQKTHKKIIKQFKLNMTDNNAITPKHAWDLIVNTAIDTPENIARTIAQFIESQWLEI